MSNNNEDTILALEIDTEEKCGYKKTKLGWIPEDWSVQKLGELTTKVGSGSTPRGGSKVYVTNGIPFIRSQNVLTNTLSLDSIAYITSEVHVTMKNTVVLPNDVLLNITGASIGRSCVVPNLFKEGNVNQHVCIIRVKANLLLNGYLQLFLSSSKGQRIIFSSQVGGNREGLNHSNINSIKLPLPLFEEQKAIANCLSTWDASIAKQSQLIAEKKHLKKALMQQLLSGKKRLPGFDAEWENLKFSDIAERVKRKNEEANDTVVTISAQRGFVLQEDFFNKRVASDTLLNYTLVHKGEFCYNKSYSKGYPMGAFKRLDSFEKAVVTALYICFSLRENVDSDFMMHYFEAGKMIPNLMRIAQEGGRAHGLLNISLPDFFSLQVSIPLLEEQTAIALVLNAADQEIDLLNKQLERLKEQKKGLMQQLLTGKKRLKF